MKTRTTTLTLALTAAIGTAGIAYAAEGNPFALNGLSQGYQVTQAEKAKDGKCGEGKCGGSKAKATDAKAKDGKCGEGKCGGSKAKATETKAKDGKCGEGKCGGSKKK
ncbi:MAG TPA: hypothetical protein VIN38_02100 [Thiobacillus sp.]